MLPHGFARYVATLAVTLLCLAGAASAGAQSSAAAAAGGDTTGPSLPDTLPRYRNVRGASRDRPALIAAVVDALHGRMSFPPPLVLQSLHRDGRTVLIDMVADSLPSVRWRGGGGTVRILADGRRVIVRRHN